MDTMSRIRGKDLLLANTSLDHGWTQKLPEKWILICE